MQTIDEYIGTFPESTQHLLETIRATLKKAVPDCTEHISYQIPTLKLNGKILLSFAGYKTHLALYPAPLSHADFAKALAPYASGKATARFALEQPLPLELIVRIAEHRQRHVRGV